MVSKPNATHRCPRHKPDRTSPHAWPPWTRRWVLAGSLVSGVLALLWLLLRTGTKPSRLAYPCQQAALGTATATFVVPLGAALLALRRVGRRSSSLSAGLRTLPGQATLAGCILFGVGLIVLASSDPGYRGRIVAGIPDYHPDVYLVSDARGIEAGRYGGVDDLITLMGVDGFKWHRSTTTSITSGPNGIIDTDDVVLIKVNAQWPQRGGTNTDVLRGVIRRIVEHPDGFVGEVVVADNGQSGGNLDRPENNAEDHGQSPQDVVNDFADQGWTISTRLWDTIRNISVDEYSGGDMASGYVVNPDEDPETQINVSYPKFRSDPGTYISYKYGIWSSESQTYDPDKLVVINMPVFKTHSIYAITASVKNHMGVITTGLATHSHAGVGRGGMGSVLAEVRMPDLTILDCIWILARPGQGPGASYSNASRRDQLLAGADPVALDMWATKYIMIPQIIENGYSYNQYHDTQDPDNSQSTFRRYLDPSMNEMLLARIDTTNDYTAVDLHVWQGDLDLDGDIDLVDFAELYDCLHGPGVGISEPCETADFDEDLDVDLGDFSTLQTMFTGEL